jgi:hypothetical protein
MLALTRNRMTMRRVEGTECSGEELKKQNDHLGVAETECLRDELKEKNAHWKSCRNRMLMGRATGTE